MAWNHQICQSIYQGMCYLPNYQDTTTSQSPTQTQWNPTGNMGNHHNGFYYRSTNVQRIWQHPYSCRLPQQSNYPLPMCRRQSPWQHANEKLPNQVLPKLPLNQVTVTWYELHLKYVTLGKYHLIYHMSLHVISHVPYHVTNPSLWNHVTLEHVTLETNHMTYQGIGHLCDHMPMHDHVIEHASVMHQVHWLACGRLWKRSTVYQTINQVTRYLCAAL